jgi:hypothetical protein
VFAERLSVGQIVSAIAGTALLVSTFLPWYGGGGVDFKLWDGPTFDIYLAITAVIAMLPAALSLTDAAEEFSFVAAASFVLGAVGTILVIAFLTVDFPDGAERKIGVWIGLVAVIGVAVGGFRAMQEEAAGEI